MNRPATSPTESSSSAALHADHPLQPALLLWLLVWVAAGAFALAMGATMDADTSPMTPFGWGIANGLVFAALVAWFVLPDPEARRIFSKPRPRALEFCILAGLVGGFALWQLDAWLADLLPPYPWELPEKAAGLPFGVAILTVAVLPAFFEEWMYRGLLLQRFRRVLPLGLALCVQAMMFAVLHMSTTDLLPLFASGMLAGILRVVADSLWPCIALHFCWNAMVTAIAYEVV